MSDPSVYLVTSLEDNNTQGTLRYSINQSKLNPYSVIVFAVNGVITAFFKKMFIFHENDQKTHVITKSY